MKVDMHFHLEEGPYSLRWLSRTVQALASTESGVAGQFGHHSLEYINHISNQLSSRMQQGCFSEEWLDRYLATGRERGIQPSALWTTCTVSGNADPIMKSICCWMTARWANCRESGWIRYA